MTMLRTLSLTALLLPTLLACSEASFTGDAASRATKQETPVPQPSSTPTTPGGDASLGCSIEPVSVKIGLAAQVLVKTTNTNEALFQTVIEGSARLASALRFGGPETRGLYIREDGTANEVKGTVAGTLTVELRRVKDSATADATCQLAVTTEPSVVTDPTPETPIAPVCSDTERKIGAEIAFLIDNSNSNAATDCPDDKYLGESEGVSVYECQSETNREKAVLAAYDVLRDVATSENGNVLANSRIAIGSFPTAQDTAFGWKNQTQGFVDVLSASRDSIASAMIFARKPAGMTPYGSAMGGAKDVFNASANDKRAKIAVLVTDGEPTDGAPDSVTAKAAELTAKGVEVITVFVTSGEARQSRETKHIAMLKKIDDKRLAQTNNKTHWYDAKYASFDAYVQSLLGGSAQQGVIRTISGKIIEVSDSAGLTNAFMHIIKTEAVKCTP